MTEAILKIKSLVQAKKSRSFNLAFLRNLKFETLNIFIISGIIVAAILYLFTSNNVVLANYQKTVVQKNIDGLKMEIRSLNLELTEKRSVTYLKQTAENTDLVVSDNIQYIKGAGAVAKNNP